MQGRGYDRRVPLWVVALIVCLTGAAASIAYATWRGLQLWRGTKRTLDVLGAAGGRVTTGLAQLSESSAQLAAAPGRLGEAGADLQRSVAAARLVADAAAEARAAAENATALIRNR